MIRMFTLLQIATLATLAAGCASPTGGKIEDRSSESAASSSPPTQQSSTAPEPDVPVNPTGSITLPQALDLALAYNLDLKAAAHGVRAEQALSKQARRLPNPELEAEVEEYDRDGAGSESAETSLTLGMTIELGGKRRLRKTAAESSAAAVSSDYESKKLELTANTKQAFMAVVAAREHLELATAMSELAKEVHNAVSEKVTAGKEPPFQAAKTEGALEIAGIEATEAESDLKMAKMKLAAMWGATEAKFEDVDATLALTLDKLPTLKELRPRLLDSPAVARCNAQVRMQNALLKAEKAGRIPDLETSVGLSQYEEDDTSALAFGVGITLPIFDWNSGNVNAAEQEMLKAKAERRSTELALANELAEIRAALEVAHKRARVLESKVVPAMESAFESAHTGYREGKFRLLELLDARQGLYDTKAAMVDALLEAHNALADIERVIGMSLIDIPKKEDK